jgi:hypothetical protein
MKNTFTMNNARLKLYLNENEGWLETLKLHTNEIPAMKTMLTAIDTSETAAETEKRGKDLFNSQLAIQQLEMQLLNEEFNLQQERLKKDSETDIRYDIDAFCTQDILRERIKAIEKMYIDLKCNFMNYVAAMA